MKTGNGQLICIKSVGFEALKCLCEKGLSEARDVWKMTIETTD